MKVQSSTGQGSADAVYELANFAWSLPRPTLHPKLKENAWEERQFTRELSRDRSEQLARRGGLSVDACATSRDLSGGLAAGSGAAATGDAPAGRCGRNALARPAEAHRIKLRIEKAENIAIEIETPEATMPRFNPVILLFEPGGAEVATNVYTKRNNNGLVHDEDDPVESHAAASCSGRLRDGDSRYHDGSRRRRFPLSRPCPPADSARRQVGSRRRTDQSSAEERRGTSASLWNVKKDSTD